MKKNLLLLSSMLLAMTGCTNELDDSSSEVESESSSVASETNTESSSTPIEPSDSWNIYNEDYSDLMSLDSLNDPQAKEYYPLDGNYDSEGINYDTIKYTETYVNNKKVSNDTTIDQTKDDLKYIFYNDSSARFVNSSEGFAITMPTTTNLKANFSIGTRSQIYNEESTLTITKETKNPYDSWETYRDEWLLKFFEDKYVENWLEKNRLEFTRGATFEDVKILNGYSVTEYDVEIKEPGMITKMYYNIGVIRSKPSKKNFYLLVMKSNKNRDDEFRQMIKSFKVVDAMGTPNYNTYLNMEAKPNPNWNEATRKYYDKLRSQDYTSWGFYNGNLNELDSFNNKQEKYKEAFECNFELVSSYSHISWGGGFKSGRFPLDNAKVVCGDGFDGKPVLQFNYQFTDNNNDLGGNNTSNNFSPMFDILRGDNGNPNDFFSYQNDAALNLKRLAKDIKDYGKPVLFRLNNEMNTDWTSYCGMINMLDPDLYAASWRLLYKIFEDNGVDNCIWIFNPSTPSIPYSSWGEDLCYFPGNDYVQVLGLTRYVMNNSNECTKQTFRSCYTDLYNYVNPIWNQYPWIISEFGCGSGGSLSGTLYRYKLDQAKWVEDMFVDLNNREDYCKNIKGAVWFSVNDYSNGKISNALEIVSTLTETIEAFKEGFNN